MEKTKTTAKDFFLCLGIGIGLYTSTISFLVLAFQITDYLFPLSGEYLSVDGMIRSSIAALVIFFPVFLYLLKLGNDDLAAHPEKKDIWVRRWMIYLTLFLAGLAMAIDLVTLVYRFLGAEDLTLRFFLKVALVFVTALVVFRSMLADLRRTAFAVTRWMKVETIITAVVLLAAVVGGVCIIGSPAAQHAKQLDATRVSDLASIQNQIVYTQWTNKGMVPETLDALKDPISGYTLPTDPETHAAYEYAKLSKNSFELCATFSTASDAVANGSTRAAYPNMPENENWQHPAGHACFTRTIDPTLYKVAPVK